MSNIEGVKNEVVFNTSEQTAKVITTDKDGKKTVVTIFANSNDKNTKNNSIFDANDKITVTDGQGNTIRNPKVDAGLVSKLLSAINGQTIKQASEIKNIEASGKLFDPTSTKTNGITREIKTAGTLCDAAIKAANGFISTNGINQTGNISNNGGPYYVPPTYSNEDGLGELRERYAMYQNRQMILQNLANLVGQSQISMQTMTSPFAQMVPMIFAANGFPIAALSAMQQHPVVQIFQSTAGISIDTAIAQLNAEGAAIEAELKRHGITVQALINHLNPNRLRQATPGHIETPPSNANPSVGMPALDNNNAKNASAITVKIEGSTENESAENDKKDLTTDELKSFMSNITTEDLKSFNLKELKDIRAKIEKAFGSDDNELKIDLTASIRKIIDLKAQLGNTNLVAERGKIKNQITDEINNLKTLLDGKQPTQKKQKRDKPATAETTIKNAKLDTDTQTLDFDPKAKITKEDFKNYTEKLELSSAQIDLIRKMLAQKLPDKDKSQLINILEKTNELEESENLTDTTKADQLAKIKEELAKFVCENSEELKNEQLKINLDAKNIAQIMHTEITDTWFDRDIFEDACKEINSNNIIEVFDAYEQYQNQDKKENLWQGIQGEWMTTARKKIYYDYIVKAITDLAKKHNINVETDNDFRNFQQTYKNEFAKTSLFDGDTKEGEVRFAFEKILQRLRNLEKNSPNLDLWSSKG